MWIHLISKFSMWLTRVYIIIKATKIVEKVKLIFPTKMVQSRVSLFKSLSKFN